MMDNISLCFFLFHRSIHKSSGEALSGAEEIIMEWPQINLLNEVTR